MWTCPACHRTFGRNGQRHDCAPALSIEEYFSTGPAFERPVFEAVLAHVEGLGPCQVEAVSVGIFFKRSRSFAQLRPMQRWVALSFSLPRAVRHPLITRRVVPYGRHFHHVANLRIPDDLDNELREHLTEAYLDAGPDALPGA